MTTLLVALLTGPAAAVPADCPYGINAHLASDDALELAADLGVGWVRMDMNWFQTEPSQGVYNWTHADRFVAKADALGLNVFITIAYGPDWAVQGPCNEADPNPVNQCRTRTPDTAAWTGFVTAAVDRYGDRVKHWGMWNEPNLEHFFVGTQDEYVNTLLVPGSGAVHAACTDCKVLGPELAHLRQGDNWNGDNGLCIAGECVQNGWEISLAEILDDGGSAIDIITHHRYADPADEWWTQSLEGETVFIKVSSGIKEVTDAHAPGKPVWITEFGWHTSPGGPHSRPYAGQQLYDFYDTMHTVRDGTYTGSANVPWPELEKAFWYDLNDDPTVYAGGVRSTWGLLDDHLAPKDAYWDYMDVIAAHGGCPATTDPGDTDDPGDTGTPDTDDPVDTDDPGSDTDTPEDDTGGVGEDTGRDTGGNEAQPEYPGGCGCNGTGGGAGFVAVLLAAVARRRRR